jgi:hypothetical protein
MVELIGFNQPEAVLEMFRRRQTAVIQVIEDSEVHYAPTLPRTIQNQRLMITFCSV